MNVYLLKGITNDPRFESFDFEGAPSLLGKGTLDDDLNDGLGGKLDWEPNRLSQVWAPQRAFGAVRSFVDHTRISLFQPAFSQRAVRVLEDLLLPHGEILPLIADAGKYYLYNILTISDALDLSKSIADFPVPPETKETAYGIAYYVFDEEKLKGQSIFRLRVYPQHVYVTETFKQRVEAAKLNGFAFHIVAPLPTGTDWEMLRTKDWRAQRAQSQSLNGQSVSILLETEEAEATQAEIDLGYVIAEDAAQALSKAQPSLNDPYLGGMDELDSAKNTLRINLSGPDSNQILETLRPMLDIIVWPRKVHVVVWQGHRLDKKTPKTKTRIK